HKGHHGIVRMKGLARDYVWWPALDKEVEQCVANCAVCQESRPLPPRAEPLTWEPPSSPWTRLHIDLAGPFMGQTFLITVDAYSKWVEVAQMQSTQSQAIIEALMTLFATHGFPDLLVSDNGPQFTSVLFESFLATAGIRHALSSPWHPASNGQAERAVRSVKDSLKRLPQNSWKARLADVLMTQHTTPCVTTGKTPAELLMGRKLRIILDRLHPGYAGTVQWPEAARREVTVGDAVFARAYSGQKNWEKGFPDEALGSKVAQSSPCLLCGHLPQGASRPQSRQGELCAALEPGVALKKTLAATAVTATASPPLPPPPPVATFPKKPPIHSGGKDTFALLQSPGGSEEKGGCSGGGCCSLSSSSSSCGHLPQGSSRLQRKQGELCATSEPGGGRGGETTAVTAAAANVFFKATPSSKANTDHTNTDQY
ncbi:uncharacterized protein, partial [Erythrolamprus reginae]|uniref:uncharacterized protein n=1 Tax=Erythrolamprus reginae TaxID=121349 RepID=UPI00396CCA29